MGEAVRRPRSTGPRSPEVLTEPASYPRRRDVRSGASGRVPVPAPSEGPDEGAGAALRPSPTRGTEELSLIHSDDSARGRHATGRGDGFGRLVALTVLGAVVPGAGLLAAGRRRWGWAVLVPVLFVLGGGAAVVATGHGVDVARRYAFAPKVMLALAVGAVGVALAWCVVIVASHLALRRDRLTGPQRVLSMLLVSALMGLVVLPSATAARYAMTNRSLLLSVFGAGGTGAGPDAAAADPWAAVPRVNMLLVGADSSQGHEGTRPDTVIVASMNTKTGDTVLFNLPRQLSDVPFPAGTAAARAWPTACKANGTGGCMLNATYLFGVQHPELFPGAADPGLEATRAAASGITGLTITNEAMINLDGFEDLVNAMGGITLTVPRAYPIGGGHDLIHGGTYKITGHLPVGKDQHLNGYLAEWYVRSRADSDNNDRMDRQRCFINAAVHQYSVMDLAKAFPALAASAEKDFETDIPAKQLNAFIDLGLRVKDASLRSLSFTEANTNTGDPDYAQLQAMVQDALVPPAPAATAPVTPSASSSASSSASAAPAPAVTADPDAAVDADSVCPS
jgi:polyisoprenyl-teichoic acid--peptidoglycan teichoic acid transferase